MSRSQVKYEKYARGDVTDALLGECATLFSSHYGTWAADFPKIDRRGKQIQLSLRRLYEFLPDDDSWIVTARAKGSLVGYATAIWARTESSTVSWVTQLVVDEAFRHQGIATTLLASIWGYSNHSAWGLVSANPFAIRVLEKATRRTIDPTEMAKNETLLREVFARIPYLSRALFQVSEAKSLVDTAFHQDLSTVDEKVQALISQGVTWRLGELLPGHEWLGATFASQRAASWTQEEAEKILLGSRDIALQAYERMALANPTTSHAWARHAPVEIETLLSMVELPADARVLDFGCGSGRHAIELAKRDFEVVGVDASETFIKDARNQANLAGLTNIKFLHEDGVSWRREAEFDLGLCLYDVIGSFPVDAINEALFANLVQSVRPGGWIAVSVMSYEYLLGRKPKLATSSEVHNHLVDLLPSNVMEQSGEVFDGRFVLLDTQRRIAYRKEQFAVGAHPPIELLIADRRYDMGELRDLCERYGVEVHQLGYVRAGKFAPQTTTVTKELLVVGRRRAT